VRDHFIMDLENVSKNAPALPAYIIGIKEEGENE
jgi:hypothetical protein